MATETTLTIEAMGRHGEGVARDPGDPAGGPVYVPFTLPGERVRAALDGKRGRLLEVLEASPDRIEPFCPHFTRCGGCAVQHWSEPRYRAWKRGLVETALRHRGLDAPVAEPVDAHGEGRRRVTLHVRFAGGHDGGRATAGFMEPRSHRLVDLDACPVLAPALAPAPDIARALGAPFAGRAKALDVLVTESDAGLDCALRAPLPEDPAIRLELTAIAERLGLARVAVNRELIVEFRPPGLVAGTARIPLPPGAFLQATAAGEAALARLVLDGVEDARRVADLFCGVGPFALRLAGRAAVHAVDSDAASVGAVDRAARATQGLKPVTTEIRDLFRRPLAAHELDRFDAVVFDPPRAGAEAQAGQLARSKVPAVAAVSCDPASFARDAAILAEGGYRIAAVVPVDQFRHSAHVEIAAIFRRG